MERLVEEKERGQRKGDGGEWLTSPPTVGGRMCPSPEEKHVLCAVYRKCKTELFAFSKHILNIKKGLFASKGAIQNPISDRQP